MERLSMRKIREVLRLSWEAGLTARQIAGSLQLARSTVGECLRRFHESGLSWPLPAELGDADLERRLFPPPVRSLGRSRPLPDWAAVHQELKRKGVTLALLWQEYKLAHPDGFQCSRFCDQYRAWAGTLDVVMRQTPRGRQNLDRMRLGPGGLSPRLHRRLPPPAAAPGGPRPGPRRRPLPQAARRPRQNRSPRSR